jgi:nitrogen regulatory protein P-II 1
MKRINANIRIQRFDDVRRALAEVGLGGIVAHEVRAFLPIGVDFRAHGLEFAPQIEFYIIVADNMVGRAVEVIERAAKTGNAVFDGRISILPVEEVVLIATGERGEEAL